jgi:hypothetical protein
MSRVKPSNYRAVRANFSEAVSYRETRTDIFSEIIAIEADTEIRAIDVTGELHTLTDIHLEAAELKHSPTARQVNGAIKGLRLVSPPNSLSATFLTWTGHRVCFLNEKECVKTIDIDDSGADSPEIDCVAFCSERSLLIMGDNYRTLRFSPVSYVNAGSLISTMTLKFGPRRLNQTMNVSLMRPTTAPCSTSTCRPSTAKVLSAVKI